MREQEDISALQFFLLGLLVFLVLGMDMFVMVLDQWLWGNLLKIDDFFASPWYVIITHWSIVILLWAVGAGLFFAWLRKKGALKSVISVRWSSKGVPLLIVAVVMSFFFAVIESVMMDGNLPQIYNEYQSFARDYGSMGLFVALNQNIYYIVEAVLVVLLVALMQRAGEIWFKKPNLPYGGVGLMVTWGLSHLMHGLADGLYITAFALVFGWLFVKAGKHWWPSLLFVWLMFIF